MCFVLFLFFFIFHLFSSGFYGITNIECARIEAVMDTCVDYPAMFKWFREDDPKEQVNVYHAFITSLCIDEHILTVTFYRPNDVLFYTVKL